MFKIGEFARISHVPVSALRYYDEVGLMKPARIDKWTGYRYYTFDQLPHLNRILALKDLGLSLEEIRRLMGEELPVDEIRGMLRLKRAELREQARDLEARLHRVEARIKQIEMEGKMSDYDVLIKKVDAQRVAIVRERVPNMDVITPTLDRLFDEVTGHVKRNNAGFAGPAVAVYYNMDESMENFDVEAAVPTSGFPPETEQVKIAELPAVDSVATTVHRGPFATLSGAYGAVMTWITENGYRISGPTREVYLEYDRDGDPETYVTEVQLPVMRDA